MRLINVRRLGKPQPACRRFQGDSVTTLALLVFIACLVARVFYVAGYKAAANRARQIAEMARVDIVRADVPVDCDPDGPGAFDRWP